MLLYVSTFVATCDVLYVRAATVVRVDDLRKHDRMRVTHVPKLVALACPLPGPGGDPAGCASEVSETGAVSQLCAFGGLGCLAFGAVEVSIILFEDVVLVVVMVAQLGWLFLRGSGLADRLQFAVPSDSALCLEFA